MKKRKKKKRGKYPALSMKGSKNPPKQLSTCNPILYLTAIFERASISSTIP